jgi:hypothetical protein
MFVFELLLYIVAFCVAVLLLKCELVMFSVVWFSNAIVLPYSALFSSNVTLFICISVGCVLFISIPPPSEVALLFVKVQLFSFRLLSV